MQKTILITGVTSGIGKALVAHFLALNEHVVGIARNPLKLTMLTEEMKKLKLGGKLTVLTCDLSSFQAIKNTIKAIHHDYSEGIDVLINNAAIVPKKKKTTEDGFEMQYQVNHLAAALFTLELKPLLDQKNGLVITTSSNAHKKARYDETDLQSLKKYHTLRSYARTKLYNVLFTLGLRDEFGHTPTRFYAVHPGLVRTDIGTKDTSRFYALMWRLFTRRGFLPEETVYTYHDLVYQPQHEAPYFYLQKPHTPSSIALNEKNRHHLYQQTIKDLKPYRK